MTTLNTHIHLRDEVVGDKMVAATWNGAQSGNYVAYANQLYDDNKQGYLTEYKRTFNVNDREIYIDEYPKLWEYYTDNKITTLGTIYKVAGNETLDNILALSITDELKGNVYNVSSVGEDKTKGTIPSDKSASGKDEDVYIGDQILINQDGKLDNLRGFIDLTAYQTKILASNPFPATWTNRPTTIEDSIKWLYDTQRVKAGTNISITGDAVSGWTIANTYILKGDNVDTTILADGTIALNNHHTVLEKSFVVESQYNDSFFTYGIECGIAGIDLTIANVNDVPEIGGTIVKKDTKVILTKADTKTGYFDLCYCSRTSAAVGEKILLKNSDGTEQVYHAIWCLDTPFDCTATIITDLPWSFRSFITGDNIIGWEVIVPADWTGEIEISCIKGRAGSGSFIPVVGADVSWNRFASSSEPKTGNVRYASAHTSEQTIEEWGQIPGNILREKSGKIEVDLLVNIPQKFSVGSKVSDIIVNDILLHNYQNVNIKKFQSIDQKINNITVDQDGNLKLYGNVLFDVDGVQYSMKQIVDALKSLGKL